MKIKQLSKADLCRKYRDKYGMGMPTLTLAKKIYQENPMLFKSVEDARNRLNYIEGKRGKEMRKKVLNSPYFNPQERPKNPYYLPEPEEQDLEPFKLPLAFNNFILAADFHVPNHRNEPITAMLDYAKKHNIRKLFLNGDLLDNTPFTRWQRDPISPKDVPRWFDMAKALLIEFKKYFDEIYWLEGNHDYWYERYLIQKAPELFGDPYYKLEARLGLNSLGIKYIDQRYVVKAGRLNIVHGHILFRGGGNYANGAKMLFTKTKTNAIASHLHVESSHTEPDLDDKIITTFVTGCMCSLRPIYQPYGGKACHGFAHITIAENRDFVVRNYRIYKGKIL